MMTWIASALHLMCVSPSSAKRMSLENLMYSSYLTGKYIPSATPEFALDSASGERAQSALLQRQLLPQGGIQGFYNQNAQIYRQNVQIRPVDQTVQAKKGACTCWNSAWITSVEVWRGPKAECPQSCTKDLCADERYKLDKLPGEYQEMFEHPKIAQVCMPDSSNNSLSQCLCIDNTVTQRYYEKLSTKPEKSKWKMRPSQLREGKSDKFSHGTECVEKCAEQCPTYISPMSWHGFCIRGWRK